VEAAIRNRNRTGAPKEFTFERSSDWGLTWEVVHTATMNIDWDPNQETRLFDLTQPSSVGIRGDWHIDMARVATGWTVSNLASAGTNVSGGDNDAGFVVSNKPLGSSPRYFEVRIDARGPGANTGYVGIVEEGQRVYYQSTQMADRTRCYGYRENGEIRTSTGILDTASAYGAGDIVMVAYDPTAKTVQFGRNGAWHPATFTFAAGYTHYAAFGLRDQSDAATLIGNEADFTYSKPSGFFDLEAG
jgi:SPRY domain